MAARHYVYELTAPCGRVVYVGKGSGLRLKRQCSRTGLSGRIVSEHRTDKEAYCAEVARIAELRPEMNVLRGGNGPRVSLKRPPKWYREIERVGVRVYAARLLLKFAPHMIAPSKVDEIRQVARG